MIPASDSELWGMLSARKMQHCAAVTEAILHHMPSATVYLCMPMM